MGSGQYRRQCLAAFLKSATGRRWLSYVLVVALLGSGMALFIGNWFACFAVMLVLVVALEFHILGENPDIAFTHLEQSRYRLVAPLSSVIYFALVALPLFFPNNDIIIKFNSVTKFADDWFALGEILRANASRFELNSADALIASIKLGFILMPIAFIGSCLLRVVSIMRGHFTVACRNHHSLILPMIVPLAAVFALLGSTIESPEFLLSGKATIFDSIAIQLMIPGLFWLVTSHFLIPRQLAAFRFFASEQRLCEGTR